MVVAEVVSYVVHVEVVHGLAQQVRREADLDAAARVAYELLGFLVKECCMP